MPLGATLPGHDFAWTYDDIGNRMTATRNSQLSTYTPTLLNTYSQRTVPGSFDLLAAADPAATVTYQYPAATGVPTPLPRVGGLLYKQLTADNSAAAVNATVKVTGVKNNIGPAGEDAITAITKAAYVPQTPEAFTHDADGNLTDDARWHYTWDGENRLIAMETSAAAITAGVTPRKLEFAYDGQSRRISKKVYSWSAGSWVLDSSLLFLYDGWNLLTELSFNFQLSTFSLARSYTWGLDLSGSMQGAGGVGGLLLSTFTSQLSTYASAYDGNGNVIGLVDMATGAKSATYEYNAFGETIISDGVAATANPFRFSTKYTDNESGLLYYGLRYYYANTGRWLSRDPIQEGDSANVYGFVGNDPCGRFDMYGLWATTGHDAIAAFWLKGREVMHNCCELDVLKIIQAGARSVDGDGFGPIAFMSAQSSGTSYQHAMRAPGQSVPEAKALYEQFINEHLTAALTIARAARETSSAYYRCRGLHAALFELGIATHPFEDDFSPAHHGFQVWFGPLDGSGLFGIGGYTAFVLNHHFKETDDKLPIAEVAQAVEAKFGGALHEITGQ